MDACSTHMYTLSKCELSVRHKLCHFVCKHVNHAMTQKDTVTCTLDHVVRMCKGGMNEEEKMCNILLFLNICIFVFSQSL